jgi:hypothetical protein
MPLLAALFALAGCAAGPGQTVFISVPAAYLEPCAIPPLPTDTGALSEAFAEAAQCAKQGNDDKKAIREHIQRSRKP